MKLFRGFNSKVTDGILDNIFLINKRKPLHTPERVHTITDSWFYNKFGIYARSECIFCTPDIHEALKYSIPHEGGCLTEVSPVGDYHLILSEKVEDFNLYVDEIGDNERDINKWLEQQSYVCINNIEQIPDGFLGEIMLFCEKYSITIINT